ncbi:glutathione S-transferase family protein [Falsirhodobacter halotolerans]|uniref:glutathione S-transferase family protein n=1 Tax=Falsirhodobacter halotolerans TaxID=1146892 RepID=UPI001FCF93FF|nr:glutathione S-transferase family protein [Falsirhodobacter halotolerans]MCJ8140112.1 glutathione S-transferase [Falsirhodobacter halotolerans]
MKIYLNGTSPFARLVRATALELDLKPIELEWVDPWSDQPGLLAVNPLSRVPALQEEDGTVLTETLLIVRHLIESAGHDAELRAEDMRTISELGVAYGMMELAFAFTIHKKHCGDAGTTLQDRRRTSLGRGLHAMETAVAEDSRWSLSRLCLWITLDYIRFRDVTDFRADRYPALTALFAAHKDRFALQKTSFA